MGNPTLTVSGFNAGAGTCTVSPSILDVNKNDTVDVQVENGQWPTTNTNSGTCSLTFIKNSNGNTIDPFPSAPSDVNVAQNGGGTLGTIRGNASETSDQYDLTMVIDNVTYTCDPTIQVGGKQ